MNFNVTEDEKEQTMMKLWELLPCLKSSRKMKYFVNSMHFGIQVVLYFRSLAKWGLLVEVVIASKEDLYDVIVAVSAFLEASLMELLLISLLEGIFLFAEFGFVASWISFVVIESFLKVVLTEHCFGSLEVCEFAEIHLSYLGGTTTMKMDFDQLVQDSKFADW